jgi:hypothetical protein
MQIGNIVHANLLARTQSRPIPPTDRVVVGRLPPAIENGSASAIIGIWAPTLPRHDLQAFRGRLFDHQASAALSRMSALVLPRRHTSRRPFQQGSPKRGTAHDRNGERRIVGALNREDPCLLNYFDARQLTSPANKIQATPMST